MRARDPEVLRVEQAGATLAITFTRAAQLNAYTSAQLDDLADLLTEAADDAAVRAVTLTGEGRAFSAGADLGAVRSAAAPKDPGLATLVAANRVVRALQALPQPTIAAVNGPAVGVGCSIALACDLVVAAQSAYFLLPFVDIALLPDGGATALVPAAVGRARAMGLALVPERLPAQTALSWGLIYRVVADEELAGTVRALTERFGAGSAAALTATKRAVDAAALTALEPALDRELAAQSELLGRADFAEAVAAFGERRPPRFTGA